MLLGFAVAAPIGPVGALCIDRCSSKGFAIGFATGLGAATVHGSWVFVAAMGHANNDLVVDDPLFARAASLLAAALLAWMGVKTFLRSGQVTTAVDKPRSTILTTAYISGVILASSNPATALVLLSATPPYATAGNVVFNEGAIAVALAAFAGSAIWWAVLASGIAMIRHRIHRSMLAAINRAASALLVVLAAWLAARACWL